MSSNTIGHMEKRVLLKKVLNRLRFEILPTKHHKNVKKWWADGGDSDLRFDYDLNEKSIVLDLGGYQGQWASDLFARYCCQIFIFEPVKIFSEQIKKRFLYNSNIEVFHFGLGASNRKEIIHLSADGSSVFGKTKSREEITIIDIKDWIEEKSIKKIDLIKINIEGGEYEVLNKLIDANIIPIITHIQVQFHPINKNSYTEMNKIQNELQKTHTPTFQYEFVWESWTRR